MICPQCTSEVPVTEAQYLSMYTCEKCQAVYFLDLTGQPEFGDMSAQAPIEANEEVISNEVGSEIFQPQDSLESIENVFSLPTATEAESAFGYAVSEITDFANQDGSISTLSYDLKVSGLDTKETVFLFKEAVSDVKFGWISQDIFSTIKNGECEFKNLNPVQAFVLAKRIQFIDIEMEWKQNAQI